MQKRVGLPFVILLTIYLAGCDIFTARTPEEPETARSTYSFPATPELVISNFTNSLIEKNTQNYAACFVDSIHSTRVYRFIPAVGASSRYPAFLNGWNLKSEQDYLNNTFSKMSTTGQISISLGSESYARYADSVQYTAVYTLQIPFKGAAAPTQYSGQMRISMIVDSQSAWVITIWEDTKIGTADCWSDLKGTNY